jgi:DNA-binding transcriptional LysR family regulator
MTLTQLEHVLAAHETGSFSRAARACGISQAALSNSVAKLEEELGDRIFARTTRRVALTPFGKELLPHVARVLGERDAIAEAARARQAPTSFVLGHSPLIPSQILTRILGAIRDAGFGAEIRLIEENLTDLLQRLGEHTIDIAVLPEADYASAFRSAPVFEEPLFYVPRRSIKDRTAPAELKELGGDTFVMVPDRCGLARLTRGLFAAANLPLNTYAGEAMGYHVLQEWAALDLGSAILPASRLTSGVRAVPLMREPRIPATVTYRVVWHYDYRRGKELAALLRPFRPQKPAAAPRT